MDRTDYIGSSDIAVVMGLSRWKTPLRLWAEKTGEVDPDDLSDNEAVTLGTELEEFVAKKFQKVTGMKVRRAPKHYTHGIFDYMRCQVDRLIEGTDELLEVKTCSAWKAKEWEGEEIPQEYILQVMWQLGITGRAKGWIAVLIGGQSFKYKEIEFDESLFTEMVDKAQQFWAMVKDKVEPMAVGLDNPFIIDIHPKADELIQEVEEMNDAIGLLMQTKGNITDLIAQKDEIEAKLKQVIGDNLGIKTKEYVVTWKEQNRAMVDVMRLKDDGLYDQYKKETPSRVLRVKKENTDG